MKALDYVLNNDIEVVRFLKGRYPLYHLSNVFFRDVQYGIQTLLERKGLGAGYSEAEKIARAFVGQLEKKKILRPIDRQTWVLHYEEYRKPAVKPAAPAARPAPSAAAASRPAGGLPPLKSATPAGAPAGFPPLKSAPKAASAAPATGPSVTAEAPAPATAEAKQPAPAKPASVAPKQPAPAGKTIPPLGKRPLPPITSSKPASGG